MQKKSVPHILAALLVFSLILVCSVPAFADAGDESDNPYLLGLQDMLSEKILALDLQCDDNFAVKTRGIATKIKAAIVESKKLNRLAGVSARVAKGAIDDRLSEENANFDDSCAPDQEPPEDDSPPEE